MSRGGRRAAPATTLVSERDAGSTIALHVGDELHVRLEATPTAGYSWRIANDVGDAVRSLGPARIEGSEPTRRGAPIHELFPFRAERPGSTSLLLVYGRPFEADRPPARTFRVEIRVEPRAARPDPDP